MWQPRLKRESHFQEVNFKDVCTAFTWNPESVIIVFVSSALVAIMLWTFHCSLYSERLMSCPVSWAPPLSCPTGDLILWGTYMKKQLWETLRARLLKSCGLGERDNLVSSTSKRMASTTMLEKFRKCQSKLLPPCSVVNSPFKLSHLGTAPIWQRES